MLPSTKAFLQAMRKHTQENTKQASDRDRATALLARIKRLGRIPKELNAADDEESKRERNLAVQLRDAHIRQIFTESEKLGLA